MSNRVEKVNSLLRDEISKIILRDFDFFLPASRQGQEVLVTLTRVECSANLFEAKAYISVYPETESDKILKVLNKSIYDIQHKINRTLKMRPIPKIIFAGEKNISKADKVEELLTKLKIGEE